MHSISERLRSFIFVLLPILAAALLEASIQFISYRQPEASVYVKIHLQLLLEMAPFFIGHYLAWQSKGWRSWSVWLVAFVGYPLLSSVFAQHNLLFKQWHLLEIQGYCFSAGASLLWFFHHLHGRIIRSSESWAARLFSLDTMVALCIVVWAFTGAGIFLFTDDPMNNQPLAPKIDFEQIYSQFGQFMVYFWQMGCIGLAMFTVYCVNRYLLIRRLLARRGLIPFLGAALVFILIATAPLGWLLLLLPLNNVNALTLIPSGNHNPFGMDNYRIMFAFLAFTTPVILAFERKAQDARLADIARQQTRNELQLLQQQVNPHFLFNTLNNLYALCLEKSDDACKTVERLSRLLRYTVYRGQRDEVALHDEIAYLQDYLALQKLRYTDNCQFRCSWPQHTEQWKMPPLLLIIVVENAFKHGIEKAPKPCEFTLDIQVNKGRLFFRCTNPMADENAAENALPQSLESGMGLDNLRRRLALQFSEGRHRLISQPYGQVWLTELEIELSPC